MATKRWLGNAASVADLWTISLSGTVTTQTYSMTINSKSVTYTSSSADTVTTILAALAAAWNPVFPVSPPEFAEYTAAALPVGGPYTSMTLTGNTAGKPGTISVSTEGAATFSIAHTTTATGPNDFNNGQNWSGGSAPANSDTLVFDNGSISCKYNLSTSLTGITVSIEPAYSGQIGLPFINSDNTVTYAEYRTTSLTLAGGTVVVNSPSVSRVNLAFGANTASIRVVNCGPRPDPNTPVVLITGGNSSTELDVTKGDVGIAFYQGTTATIATIKTSFSSQQTALSDVSVIVGTGATLTTVTKNGGTFDTRSNLTTLTQQILGGVTTFWDAVTATTVNIQNGTLNLNTTGTVGTVNLYGKGTLNANGDPRAKTITNAINCYNADKSVVTVYDDAKTINSGALTLAPQGCQTVNYSHGTQTQIVAT